MNTDLMILIINALITGFKNRSNCLGRLSMFMDGAAYHYKQGSPAPRAMDWCLSVACEETSCAVKGEQRAKLKPSKTISPLTPSPVPGRSIFHETSA